MAIAVAMLLGVKIFLSGWYLTSSSQKIAPPGLVLAEEAGSQDKQEIPLDEKLRRKEKKLQDREDRVKKRENELQLLQDKIDARMSELNDLQTKLLNFSKKLAQRENALKDAQMTHIVALYSAMDPAKAAAIMDKLNLRTVVRILKYMKGKNAGKIMAMMPPEKGATISEALSKNE
jgi:flagellar motility protein MotE (MotC chaperone)